MNDHISIRPITGEEAQPLTQIARETFYRSFIHANPEDRMNAYLDTHITEEVMTKELEDKGNIFFLIQLNNEWAGYAKLRQSGIPICISELNAIELERFYIHQDHHSKGLGSQLMKHCIDWAFSLGKQAIWLGVWEENEPAIHFYRRKGFVKRGDKDFMFHDDLQTDWIMEKIL